MMSESLFLECARWTVSSNEFKTFQVGDSLFFPVSKKHLFTSYLVTIKGQKIMPVLLEKTQKTLLITEKTL